MSKKDICHWQGRTCEQKWAEEWWAWHLPGWGKSSKGTAFLKRILELCCCFWMHLLWIYGPVNFWFMFGLYTAGLLHLCMKAMCRSSRVYEIAAEPIQIHRCQNYKSPLTYKWTLVLPVPCGESKRHLLLLSFPSIFVDFIYKPLPVFLSWPYDPKEAGLAGLLINSQSPSLEALLSYWAFRWGVRGGD